MIQKAMKVVIDHEDVANAKCVNFHMLYESAFNKVLNTKRSACEQAGGKIEIEAMAMMNPDEEFFTIEELCKMRRSTTEREMKVFVGSLVHSWSVFVERRRGERPCSLAWFQ